MQHEPLTSASVGLKAAGKCCIFHTSSERIARGINFVNKNEHVATTNLERYSRYVHNLLLQLSE